MSITEQLPDDHRPHVDTEISFGPLDMPQIFMCRDRWGCLVVLEEEHWVAHVITERSRTFLQGQEQAVHDTIVEPYVVTQSRSDADCKLFYRPWILQPPHDGFFLKVCVSYEPDPASGGYRSGFVVTAHPVGDVHPKEVVLYDSLA